MVMISANVLLSPRPMTQLAAPLSWLSCLTSHLRSWQMRTLSQADFCSVPGGVAGSAIRRIP